MFTRSLQAISRHSLVDECHIGSAKLPLVSIIITNYNYANFLEECIESCLAQDYEFCELILVDDLSTDNSKEIYSKYSDRVKIIVQDQNRGQLAAFFAGLSVCNGDFVVFVDADDFLDKDAVSAHMYLHLFKKPPVGFTCFRNRQVSESSSIINDFHMDLQNNGKEIAYISPRVIHTPTWSWSTTTAMCFRADLLKLIATDKTEEFRVCADYYIVHFSNLLGGSLLFDRAKANYRRHGKNNFSKNFVIGGHRPTGSDKYHAHPSQKALQKEILAKLIGEREKFEPYFPSLDRYAEAILFVAPLSFVNTNFDIEKDILSACQRRASYVEKEKNEQISIKKWAIRWFGIQNKYQKVKNIKDNILNTYGIREK